VHLWNFVRDSYEGKSKSIFTLIEQKYIFAFPCRSQRFPQHTRYIGLVSSSFQFECEAAMASPKTPSARRPKLMRASATCPQLATSNASRKDLASLHPCGATTILTRVASYSSAQHEHAMRTSPLSSCSSPGQIAEERRKEPFEIAISQCESLSSYFSQQGMVLMDW
jgi:phosphatidylinositol kinase/protein kinase (PI-3  family)